MKSKFKVASLVILLAFFAVGVSPTVEAKSTGSKGASSLSWYCFAPYFSTAKFCNKYK